MVPIYVGLTFTCTTDLGDTFYAPSQDLPFLVSIYSVEESLLLATGQILWKPRTRVVNEHVALELANGVSMKHLAQMSTAWLHVFTMPQTARIQRPNDPFDDQRHDASIRDLDLLYHISMPEIVSVWAHVTIKGTYNEITNTVSDEKKVLRRFVLCYEESIERELDSTKSTDGDDVSSRSSIREVHVWEQMGESIARHIW
jgi:hypothetical protein